MARSTVQKIAVALACSSLLVISACSSDTSSASASGGSGDSSAPLYDKLPADIQKAGHIVIGSSIDYPPFEYYDEDGTTLKGFEVELSQELEKKLGVTFDWQNASFDTLFTALRSHRYDIVYGATNDTLERQQSFDFVDYLQSSQGFVVAKGNPAKIQKVEDICGKNVAIVRGGIQGQVLEAQSGTCQQQGLQPINVLPFDGNSGEQLAVKQGQADAMLENYPTAVTFAQESGGDLEVVSGIQLSKRYFGMVVPKKDTELRDALQQAWQAIMDDGSYAAVLDKWSLTDIGIDKAQLNTAES